jgi:hypothetical protein
VENEKERKEKERNTNIGKYPILQNKRKRNIPSKENEKQSNLSILVITLR